MSSNDRLGGVIHTYQKYDPVNLPSPTAPPPDVLSHVFDHMLYYGHTRRLTDEELARAVRLDPSQIRNLGPSLEWLKALLLERKRKILSTYESSCCNWWDASRTSIRSMNWPPSTSSPARRP